MLQKVTVLDKIEVATQTFATIQVRYIKDRVIDDATGATVAEGVYWRVAYVPGDDVSHEDPQVQAVAASVWTDAVVTAYAADQQARVAKRTAGLAAANAVASGTPTVN